MTNFLIPKIDLSGFCRSTGPVDRAWSRSTGTVDRRAQTCTPGLLEGRSTDSVDRRELLLSGKPRSTGPVDRQRTLFSVPGLGRPGRSTAAPTVRNLTVGGWPGRSTVSHQGWFFAPTASFSYSFQWLYPQVLEPIFPNQKSVYQECFKSDFLEFSSTISILVFSHKHLSYPLLYLPIRVLLWDYF